MPRKPSRKTLKNKIDAIIRAKVRGRGVCEGVKIDRWFEEIGEEPIGCKGDLQWCHFKSRKYLSLRWDLQNSWCMCSKHHWYLDLNKDDWIRYMLDEEQERIEHIWENFSRVRPMSLREMTDLYEKLSEK